MLKVLFELGKIRLSLMVSLTGILGFIAEGTGTWWHALLVFAGGLLTTWGNIALNQYIERKEDAIMIRTRNRPLPAMRIPAHYAMWSGIIAVSCGLIILFFISMYVGLLALMSTIVYLGVYTPSKKVSPFSVVVGAISGGLPPLIGSISATGTITMKGLILFGFQYAWQLPHFWAIALLFAGDYERAGFKILPSRIPVSQINITVVFVSLLILGLISVFPVFLFGLNILFLTVAVFPLLVELILFNFYFSTKNNKYLISVLITIYVHLLAYMVFFILAYRGYDPWTPMMLVVFYR